MLMNQLAAILLACWLLARPVASLDISLPVEHAIGDGAFNPAGQLKGVLSPKVGALSCPPPAAGRQYVALAFCT
jgi:hypothetical protein